MTTRVVTFGEMLLRLTSPGHERLLQSARVDAAFGGAEANVAVQLAQWGIQARYVSVLPARSPLAAAARAELRRFDVDTSCLVDAPGRFGLYFMERGTDTRPSRVVYDRQGSAASLAGPGSVDWGKAFDGAQWFHTTGITPAISRSAYDLTVEAVETARDKGLTVSFDLNHRRGLWDWGRPAADVLAEFMGRADVLIASEAHLRMVLESKAVPGEGTRDTGDVEALMETALSRCPNLEFIALTVRDGSCWSACLGDGQTLHPAGRYDVSVPVDPVGAGDAFAAGMIYGVHALEGPSEAIEFAAAAGCLKHSIPGDFCRSTADDVTAVRTGARGVVR